MKHKRRQQPVTRREVLRIVQATELRLTRLIVRASPLPEPLFEAADAVPGSTTYTAFYSPMKENRTAKPA